MTRTTARPKANETRPHSKLRTPVRSGGANHVKIIAGQFRGRWIEFPDVDGLRPTGNRIRETLFNWLGQRMEGMRCLDLFSGSGALGFEAASRGAAEVVMVESAPAAIASLKANRERLGASMCAIERADALTYLRNARGHFDVIFADPPFASGSMERVLESTGARLTETGLLYCEWGAPIDQMLADPACAQWEIVRQGKAGVVHFALLKRRPALS